MGNAVKLEPFRGLDGLRSARADWEFAFEQSGVIPLSNSPTWGLAYAEAWLKDQDVFGWTARRGTEPVGFLPLRVEPSRSRYALRRALLLPDGTFDSDYLDLPVRSDCLEEVLLCFVDALDDCEGIEAFVLSGVPDDSPTLESIRSLLVSQKRPSRSRAFPCLRAPLPSSFDGYISDLPKRMRTKVRRSLRDAGERGGRHFWKDAGTWEEGLETLFRLHRARWNSVDKGGSLDDPRRQNFYDLLARTWATSGQLRLVQLSVGGSTVAVQFGVRLGNTYYQIQEGFDPTQSAWRPATALRALAVRDLIAEGVENYDFLGGDSRHKRDWGGQPRPCTTIAFPVGGVRSRLSYHIRSLFDSYLDHSA